MSPPEANPPPMHARPLAAGLRAPARVSRLSLVVGVVVWVGCGAPRAPELDAGHDAAVEVVDAGVDAGPTPEPDAGPVDSGTDAGALDAGRPAPLAMLFVGNSYTFVNDLPGMLSRLAASVPPGPAIGVDSVVVGGATLEDHWSVGLAPARITDGGFTHVVLQGQSLEADGRGSFSDFAHRFGALAVDAGVVPVWYATWARSPSDPAAYPSEWLHFDELQDRITQTYAEAAAPFPSSVLVCVGEAFRAVVQQHPEVNLYDPDHSHPSLAGTYLAAATFYVALTGQPVPSTSFTPVGLSTAHVSVLREAATVGTGCSQVKAKAKVRFADQPGFSDGGPALDLGVAGSPVHGTLVLENKSLGTATLSVLAPPLAPFRWTGGTFSGGAADAGFCGSTIPGLSRCTLGVTFDGTSSATQVLKLGTANDYVGRLEHAVRGTSTSRALLVVTDIGGCIDPNCATVFRAARGERQAMVLSVVNRGALPTTSLSVWPLTPPFFWGAEDGGTFPGIDGGCDQVVPAGGSCALQVRFVPEPDGGLVVSEVLDVTYGDAVGGGLNVQRQLVGAGNVNGWPPVGSATKN